MRNVLVDDFRYHGHLLLSHIIAKFAIHKRIVLQGTSAYCENKKIEICQPSI